ncbi:MAG: zinc-binding dehydrogenase [Candidatus Eremiobacteraeota bacterium]|nr:zinc-binding dehydrogenase [Candidatus Eremiobacteraeota bacterium]
MKAIRLHETGGPKNLVLDRDVAVPEAGPREVLVRLRYAALNHRDVFITQGLYPGIELPRILGSDGCGYVEQLGSHAMGPAPGTCVVIDPTMEWGSNPRVWSEKSSLLGMPKDGTFAQYVAVPGENVFAKPAGLSEEEAAAIPLAGVTAYRAAFTRGALTKNDTLLVTGIGGGVQTFVLLFAKQAGARVVVTSSSDEKLARARALGADETLNYRSDPQWHKSAKKMGIDIAIDSAGGEGFAKVLETVKYGGRVVTYGGTSGTAPVRPFSIFWKQLDVLGTSMGSPHDFAAMLERFDGTIKPVIDRVYAMDEAVLAAQRLDEAAQFGKVLLRIEP